MKTVLITGGSRGIGAACVRAFAGAGWLPLTCARRETGDVSALCRETGALFTPCDVSRSDEVSRMFGFFLKKVHRIDALVLNAGQAWKGLIQDMTEEEFDSLYAADLKSAFLCVREALPGMIAAGGGSIVTVSSMWGQTGASCESAYSAFKAGLIGFTRALSRECGPSGIRVNCIAPGLIDTEMNRDLTESDREELISATPLGRIGTPGDCAAAALFLCSPASSFITGQVLGVNGGFLI
ncbi:MAG: SDR family oxidoreductase [Clostridia bacterium]|nr:SDR family oxidoreductase [Clostridia bacterium]